MQRINFTSFLLLLFLVSTTSCGGLKMGESFVKTELYFGQIQNGSEINTSEWSEFKTSTLNTYFEGYTELDAQGFWTNANGESVSEKSKLIIYLHQGTKEDYVKIEKIITAYKLKFKQESVLKINYKVRGKF